VNVADGFDLNGPHAEVIIAVLAWAAKMERLATAERIAAARERIEAEGGRRGGRGASTERRGRERSPCAAPARPSAGSPAPCTCLVRPSPGPSLRRERPEKVPRPRGTVRPQITGPSRGAVRCVLSG
jgi:hypothetical protein